MRQIDITIKRHIHELRMRGGYTDRHRESQGEGWGG